MSKHEINSLAKILSDPENSSRTAEEIAELCISALDDARSATHRLAVVGQIRFGPQEPTHTVVLGPFRAPLLLRDEDRFKAALERPCTAARDAGGHLAWDAKTGRGQGRFLLAPAFMKPRDAWDFYRGAGPAETIVQALAEDRPQHLGPACICGLKDAMACQFCGDPYVRHCPLHEPGAEIHRCRKAA
ncbi:hypothetical protein [Streptomyces himalayensis]|uniref:Uncharacterized protein n=1 Tax=Streptomyces himalayensis subsp. himalayensis TaxID=2756131 RepID=A0A7W0ID74_9ACTN|nr:hypothetical protein [Streptomyces himalayensis]MBA2951408.1 hypothetical protein [Streptomyces himalayensis subsp. himalayensis]